MAESNPEFWADAHLPKSAFPVNDFGEPIAPESPVIAPLSEPIAPLTAPNPLVPDTIKPPALYANPITMEPPAIPTIHPYEAIPSRLSPTDRRDFVNRQMSEFWSYLKAEIDTNAGECDEDGNTMAVPASLQNYTEKFMKGIVEILKVV